ncbi:amidohydrolase family protein [Thalassotalea sp. PLHSN55]|uniref:amidohydrolase family protein n=1 Tax=Thalassotalea sp. PLHSN55 TaxID=3435888 RepID=UPI003F874ADB
MKKLTKTCVAYISALLLSSASSIVLAQTIAITNATVHTVSDQGTLTNATVIVENGTISAINPAEVSADQIIDAQGKILTPGFIGSANQLGLVEVNAVSNSRDYSDKKADITFDASYAFNPKSTLIPFARKGGITRNIVTPKGGDSDFKGQVFTVDLSGEFDSIVAKNQAIVIGLGSLSKGSRAQHLMNLHNTLEDAQKKLAKSADKKGDKKAAEPKRTEIEVNALLSGDKPLLAHVDRASDILALLALKQKFNFELILVGAADAILVAKEIADANVAIILDPMRNLPGSFDSLHLALTNAGKLAKAGVQLILTVEGDSHNLHQLRYNLGNAVANGLTPEQALAAVTLNPATLFNLDSGQISVGKNADLVLWSADPFELSSRVEKMWINGKEVSTYSRQDALRDRYLSSGPLPKAYSK